MGKTLKTLASFLIAGTLLGCEKDYPPQTENSFPYQEIKLSSGFVVKGRTEEIDFGEEKIAVSPTDTSSFFAFGNAKTIKFEGKVTLVRTEHSNTVCVQGDRFIFWSDSRGRIYDNQYSDYFGHLYPSWDDDGYREFVGRTDLKFPSWVEKARAFGEKYKESEK